jgi:hypothetical protein
MAQNCSERVLNPPPGKIRQQGESSAGSNVAVSSNVSREGGQWRTRQSTEAVNGGNLWWEQCGQQQRWRLKEAVEGNLWRGAVSRSIEASAVDGGSRRRQSAEAIFGGEQRCGQQQRRQLTEAFDRGSQWRQLTEAIFGGEQRCGQQQCQQGGTEAVDGGLNFYYRRIPCVSKNP